jgi:DNA-binding SARP family transcriptional activator
MEFHILGPVECWNHGVRARLNGTRQRVLLGTLLVDANRLVSIERLSYALWEYEPPQTSRQQISNGMHSLRRAFASVGAPASTLRREPGGYLVRIDHLTLDAYRFHERRYAAARLAESGALPEAAAVLVEALALWRGPALAGVEGPVTRAAAASLDEQRLAAMEDRVDLDLACGRHHDVVGELAGLVAEHPLRERMVVQLMLALHRSGRRAEALPHFLRVRARLSDQLGMDPGDRLRHLHEAILRNSPELMAPGWTHAQYVFAGAPAWCPGERVGTVVDSPSTTSDS